MPNIRNRDAYRDRAWDWAFLNDCFGGTKIRPSDLDGLVERNGRFLVLEAKPAGASINVGQRRTLAALASLPNFTVLVLYGEPNKPVAMQAWPNDRVEASEDTIRAFVSAWFAWADQQAA